MLVVRFYKKCAIEASFSMPFLCVVPSYIHSFQQNKYLLDFGVVFQTVTSQIGQNAFRLGVNCFIMKDMLFISATNRMNLTLLFASTEFYHL